VESEDHRLKRSGSGVCKVGTFKAVALAVSVKDRWIDPRESASRPPCGFWRIDDQQLDN
jgi:hypothetical protein